MLTNTSLLKALKVLTSWRECGKIHLVKTQKYSFLKARD